MRLRRQQSEPRRRWADLVAEVDAAARSSPAGGLAAEMRAEVQALAVEHGGTLPWWLRYVDHEQER